MAKEDGRIARLNQTAIKAAAPEASRYILWDSDLKGFGLRVEPSGAKTFLVRYRVGGGRSGVRRQFKIGAYGRLTPDQARDEAEKVLAQVDLGKDPQAIRTADRATPTMAVLCDEYLETQKPLKATSTLAGDRGRIEGQIKPALGSRKITEISKADIERLRNRVADGTFARIKAEADPETGKLPPGAKATGGKPAATKTVKLLRAIFSYAIANRLCAENPAVGVKTFGDTKRTRYLSPAELARLGGALTAEEAGGGNPDHVRIIRLLALTSARKNEIAGLKWSEVKGDHLELEAGKTGARRMVLGAPAQEVLAGVEQGTSALVFPKPAKGSAFRRDLNWTWERVRTAAGLADVHMHDLRHTFASVGVSGGATLYIVGALLGHKNQSTTQRYAHLHEDPVRAEADRISGSIAASMAGKTGDVRPIRGGAR
jgi:integrase